MTRRCGVSYQKRVEDVNRIYDKWTKHGLSNREIWRRYIYPIHGISERAMYKILKASAMEKNQVPEPVRELLLFRDEDFW